MPNRTSARRRSPPLSHEDEKTDFQTRPEDLINVEKSVTLGNSSADLFSLDSDSRDNLYQGSIVVPGVTYTSMKTLRSNDDLNLTQPPISTRQSTVGSNIPHTANGSNTFEKANDPKRIVDGYETNDLFRAVSPPSSDRDDMQRLSVYQQQSLDGDLDLGLELSTILGRNPTGAIVGDAEIRAMPQIKLEHGFALKFLLLGAASAALFGFSMVFPFIFPCDVQGRSLFRIASTCHIGQADDTRTFRALLTTFSCITAIIPVVTAYSVSRMLVNKNALRLLLGDQYLFSVRESGLFATHAVEMDDPNANAIFLASGILLLIVACVIVGLVNITTLIQNSSYLFCLFILITNGMYVGGLAKLAAWSRVDKSILGAQGLNEFNRAAADYGLGSAPVYGKFSERTRYRLKEFNVYFYRAAFHFTIVHICFSLVIRTYYLSWDHLQDNSYKSNLRSQLHGFSEDVSFFTFFAVILTRALQLGAEAIYLSMLKRGLFPLNQNETGFMAKCSRFIAGFQKNRTIDAWFAVTVLVTFAYVFMWVSPILTLLCTFGISFEIFVQFIRNRVLNAPPLEDDTLLPLQVISDVALIPVYQIIVLVLLCPFYISWTAVSVPASTVAYMVFMFGASESLKRVVKNLYTGLLVARQNERNKDLTSRHRTNRNT